MNDSGAIPTQALIAWALWGLVALFMGAAWVTYIGFESRPYASLLGLTAASLVGPATVAHVRMYATRMCRLIRATSGPQRQESPGIHSVTF